MRPLGSIPACAGEPCSCRSVVSGCRVHPRVCGGAQAPNYGPLDTDGPSPRVRGSRGRPRPCRPRGGSIPACAGEPWLDARGIFRHAVHPRVCGGAQGAVYGDFNEAGPSPRVRGSHPEPCPLPGGRGSIPACAGEPVAWGRERRHRRVHPRVCGGATFSRNVILVILGPSPRVRGSPHVVQPLTARIRSIPACAGEPYARMSEKVDGRVHPRVCGGAAVCAPHRSGGTGPSPRVRGSHVLGVYGVVSDRSIPACAGEPSLEARCARAFWVHPRVCGGAPNRQHRGRRRHGPSPRVRGSLCQIIDGIPCIFSCQRAAAL